MWTKPGSLKGKNIYRHLYRRGFEMQTKSELGLEWYRNIIVAQMTTGLLCVHKIREHVSYSNSHTVYMTPLTGWGNL